MPAELALRLPGTSVPDRDRAGVFCGGKDFAVRAEREVADDAAAHPGGSPEERSRFQFAHDHQARAPDVNGVDFAVLLSGIHTPRGREPSSIRAEADVVESTCRFVVAKTRPSLRNGPRLDPSAP